VTVTLSGPVTQTLDLTLTMSLSMFLFLLPAPAGEPPLTMVDHVSR